MIGEVLALAIGVLSGQAAIPDRLDDAAYFLQRRRVMALVAEDNCAGAHGAVFVMADRPMLELVESVCPMGALDVARWAAYNPDQIRGMFTDAQISSAVAIAGGALPLLDQDEPESPSDD